MKSYKGVKSDLQELLALRYKAKGLSLFKNQVVNNTYSGNFRSKAKGRGMDFDEVRHYQAGDDIRLMHWSLTARLGKPYTKVYHEEKDRSLYFLLDQSTTMHFGTRECFKSVKVLQALALLGFSALDNSEKVGGVIYDDNGYDFYPASQDKSSLFKILNKVVNEDKSHQIKSDEGIAAALKLLYQKIKTNSVVVILSDFYNFNESAQNYLKLLTKNNQIINIFSYDPIEKELPKSGSYYFSNGQDRLELDVANKVQKKSYHNIYAKREEAISSLSRKHKMSLIKLATNDDLIKAINYGIMNNGW